MENDMPKKHQLSLDEDWVNHWNFKTTLRGSEGKEISAYYAHETQFGFVLIPNQSPVPKKPRFVTKPETRRVQGKTSKTYQRHGQPRKWNSPLISPIKFD